MDNNTSNYIEYLKVKLEKTKENIRLIAGHAAEEHHCEWEQHINALAQKLLGELEQIIQHYDEVNSDVPNAERIAAEATRRTAILSRLIKPD